MFAVFLLSFIFQLDRSKLIYKFMFPWKECRDLRNNNITNTSNITNANNNSDTEGSIFEKMNELCLSIVRKDITLHLEVSF